MKIKMEAYIDYLVKWLIDERNYRSASGFVVGVSGGVDSAVVAHLLARADIDNTLGLILPCKSNPQDLLDAKIVLDACGLSSHTVDLTQTHSTLWEAMGAEYTTGNDSDQTRVIDGNIRARLRMTTLYAAAQARNAIVVGTDNAVEWYTGYFTKFGDGGVDIVPLYHLMKDEVYEMAHILGVPDAIINKAPSAGLWEAQTDEDEMGTTYEMLNRFLRGEKIPAKDQKVIAYWHERSHHKRAMARTPNSYH